MGLPQGNVIFFFLFAAFVMIITIRGELPKYLGFILASPVTPTTQVNGGQFTTDSLGQVTGGGNLKDVATIAQTAATFL